MPPAPLSALQGHSESAWRALAQLITALENERADAALVSELQAAAKSIQVPVLGITGTGGAGKSSLTDELIRRLRLDQNDRLRVAVISIDPSRRKSGGALLGGPHPHECHRPLVPADGSGRARRLGPTRLHAQPRHP